MVERKGISNIVPGVVGLLALGGIALAACSNKSDRADPQGSAEPSGRAQGVVSAPPSTPWPNQPGASWPTRCLIEGVAIHPQEPWLAVACTDSERGTGAVLVFDARAGTLRSSTRTEQPVGWNESSDLLRWHPDGRRLASNYSTNGIVLLDRARIVGWAFPEDTRDGGVAYVWIGDRLFTDTGALFEIKEGDSRFDFEDLGAPRFEDIQRNAATGAVVGRLAPGGIASFDPIRRKVLYERQLAHLPRNGKISWSPDGRWCVRLHHGRHPEADELLFFSGDDGRLRSTIKASSPQIHSLHWAPGGALAISCYLPEVPGGRRLARHLDLVRDGQIRKTIDLGAREIQASRSVPEVSGVAWSPNAAGIALLLDRQEVQIRDARTGKVLSAFVAPAPAIPEGMPSHYTDRFGLPGGLIWLNQHLLVRLAPHFVAFWSTDGKKIAEFVVPSAR